MIDNTWSSSTGTSNMLVASNLGKLLTSLQKALAVLVLILCLLWRLKKFCEDSVFQVELLHISELMKLALFSGGGTDTDQFKYLQLSENISLFC
mmetsp:Transcript_21131/g.42609  ORF Transcript_21131/g.42609 Transcript_21131/m.42609 type:complete len:94 (-) Transcript_21131:269-550(-)